MDGNSIINRALISSLHGMVSGGMMLITVTGCKTDRKDTTPVGYYREDGYLWVVTSRDRTWWKNLRGGADVSLLLKRRPVTAIAEPELDAEAVEARLVEYVKHVPQAAKPLGIRIENGNPNAEDIARNARDRLFVKIRVLPPS